VRPWYPTKLAIAFPDLLTALRHALWQAHFCAAPVSSRRLRKRVSCWCWLPAGIGGVGRRAPRGTC
jgi:hypothetical protein